MKFNQFGGSSGGPIRRDRMFVFGVYEGYRDRSFSLVQENIPTQRLRDDMLRATPSYSLLLNFLPLPTEPHAATADIGLFKAARTSERNDDHVDPKTDMRLRSSSQLAISYSRGHPSQLVPRYYLNQSNDRDFFVHDDRGTVGFTTAGSRWTSETRFGYHRSDMTREDRFFFTQFDPANRPEELPFGRRVGRIATTLDWTTPDHEVYALQGRTWNFDQKYSRHAGTHGFMFGMSIRRDCCMRSNPEAPNLNYTSRDDLLNNIPSEVAPVFGNGDYVAKMYTVGVFGQDDWCVSDKLVPDFSSPPAAAHHALGGWRVSGIFTAQSGEPMNISQSSAIPTSRADYVGGAFINSDYRTTLQYLNPAAFAAVPVSPASRAALRPGTTANGMVRTPGAWNVDLSVARNVAIAGATSLQVRADMFNALNHTNLTGLRTNINDRLFGQLLNTRKARIIQLNARLTW